MPHDIPVYIASGFLGAGKTTLIQKLLKDAFKGEKVALVENDYGEISIDASLLAQSGSIVKEINSGCICCSLYGDFVAAVESLIKEQSPTAIIIEPSGVGKLTDIESACHELKGMAHVARKITVVDAQRGMLYLQNFGEFFEDQIKRADVLVLSRAKESGKKLAVLKDAIEQINDEAPIIDDDWDSICSFGLLGIEHDHDHEDHDHHGHDHEGHDHDHGDHDHEDHDHEGHDHEGHDHGHTAEEAFDTVTLRSGLSFTEEKLKSLFKRLEDENQGVLRAKGVVKGESGSLNVQYLPGELKVSKTSATGDALVFIGAKLDRASISRAVKGV
ncbi:MAG: GTP-binding protein [Clostridiales bacterium]|jgi:G3E family GTPase|nr:GTP-binding protein [Clostridiales bacterium]